MTLNVIFYRNFNPKAVKGRNYFDEFGGEADEGDYDSNLPEELYNVLPRSRRSANPQVGRTRPSGDYDYDSDSD